jgi:hypothetical protein
MAVMAELLVRGVNVAKPEIDVGEDLLAFQDGHRAVDRIQVKTATKVKRLKRGGYAAAVNIDLEQLRNLDDPELYYIFPVRLDGRWTDFIVISRADLRALHETEEIGYENRKLSELQLHLTFGDELSLVCSDQDLSTYRNAWERLPVLG